MKKIIDFVCIFCITWSCSSDDSLFFEKERIEKINLLSNTDIPYCLIFPLKEPFVSALTVLYQDDLGKKLCNRIKKILGNNCITLSYDPNVRPGTMLEGGLYTLKYSSVLGWDDRMIGSLFGHEFFHVYQRSRGNINSQNMLNHEIEAYVFQFKLCQRMGILPSSTSDDPQWQHVSSFWIAIGNLANLVDYDGRLKQGTTQQEFNQKYIQAISQARSYDSIYENMGEDAEFRNFSNMAYFMFEK